MRMRLPSLVAAAVVAAVPAAVSNASAADTDAICADARERYIELRGEPPPDNVVLMRQYTFCPPRITVKPGTTVTWVNVERTSHSVWLKEAGEAESDRAFMDEEWSFTFTTPGEYPYLCGPHWEKDDMVGTVIVTD